MKKNLHILRRGDGCAADGVAAAAVVVVVLAAGTGIRQRSVAEAERAGSSAGRGSAQLPVRWLSCVLIAYAGYHGRKGWGNVSNR